MCPAILESSEAPKISTFWQEIDVQTKIGWLGRSRTECRSTPTFEPKGQSASQGSKIWRSWHHWSYPKIDAEIAGQEICSTSKWFICQGRVFSTATQQFYMNLSFGGSNLHNIPSTAQTERFQQSLSQRNLLRDDVVRCCKHFSLHSKYQSDYSYWSATAC